MAARCHAVEGSIEQASANCQQTCTGLQQCLDKMRDVEAAIDQTDDVKDPRRQQEELQIAKVGVD